MTVIINLTFDFLIDSFWGLYMDIDVNIDIWNSDIGCFLTFSLFFAWKWPPPAIFYCWFALLQTLLFSLHPCAYWKKQTTVLQLSTRIVFCRFNNFHLEASSSCSHDYVAVYDGPNTGAPLLGKFCGEVLPRALKSSTNNLLLVFRTDGFGAAGGWKASFRETLGKGEIQMNCSQNLKLCYGKYYLLPLSPLLFKSIIYSEICIYAF